MNISQENSEDVEAALRSFFQAEVPQPWPRMTAPARATSAPHRSSGRLALAASIALLFAGQWWLSSAVEDSEAALVRATPALREATNRPPYKAKAQAQPLHKSHDEMKK